MLPAKYKINVDASFQDDDGKFILSSNRTSYRASRNELTIAHQFSVLSDRFQGLDS